jgi:nicotinate-nucleotide adenylyltransferase
VLLVGADAFAGLASWHRWRELFELAHVGVLTRPGAATALPPELAGEVAPRRVERADALRAAPAGRVLPIAVTALDISASKVRALLAEGRVPRYLLPPVLLDDAALLAPYRRDGGISGRPPRP